MQVHMAGYLQALYYDTGKSQKTLDPNPNNTLPILPW